ncbi:zinc finger protein 185 [Lonchura striata]
MMSLGVAKGGLILPTDEDRRRIIRQMKVRTTLRGDKSWIQHHNSDSDEEKSSPLSGQAGRGSPAPKPAAPQQDRSSASKPQSGYLIRGVFTRTIDKSSSTTDSSPSSQAQKNTSLKGQSRSPSGYRMTTEDYKKLAPYNVRQKSADGEEEDVPFSPDEHKKRTEAANSVLRRSAGRERAYVLSAAKKSNGSPTQEFPPLFAKRIEIEEEEGQQRRSPTVPGSARFAPESSSANGLRKTSPVSSWDEPKAAAASSSSPEPGSRSQTSPSLSDTLGNISISAESRNGEDRQALHGKFPLETGSQHGDGDKAVKEKPERFPWDEGAPRATRVSMNGSFPEHTEAKNGFYPSESGSGFWHTPGDAPEKLLRPSEPSQGDIRSSLQPDVPFCPTERTPVRIEDTEYSFKSSVLDYEERSSSTNPEGPSHHQPYWDETRFGLGALGCLGSSSVLEGSSIPAPEIPHANESEPHRDRSDFSSQESAPSAPESQPAVPLFQERQSFGGSVPSHRIPGYVDSQVFNTRSHDSLPRDPTMSQRSHRVPFYMDSLNSNSSRLLSSSSERLCSSHHSSGYQPDSSTAGRGILFVKEYVNTGGFAALPRHGSGSLVDLSDLGRSSYSHHSYLSSAPLHRSSEPLCSYCGREIRDCPKIIIEHLNIHCHEYCFRCGICHKAMGELLDKIFIHRDIVHCDKCYEKLF